ncbi:MAG: hypothetical protein WDO13_07625 [Verrucomicrobiota bacterium]
MRNDAHQEQSRRQTWNLLRQAGRAGRIGGTGRNRLAQVDRLQRLAAHPAGQRLGQREEILRARMDARGDAGQRLGADREGELADVVLQLGRGDEVGGRAPARRC